MSTLLLRLAAPLQSWGLASKFDSRDTAREPTKSGVIGLLAAALGRSRTDKLDDLNVLVFGVRIDQPGVLLRDYHTAHREDGRESFVTTRYYLADAVFVVGLEGENDFLQKLSYALQNPVFPLYLGRHSCPPTSPLVLGIREKSLLKALEEEPWQASDWFRKKQGKLKLDSLTIVCDTSADEPGAFWCRDLPISFDQRHRQYGFRAVIDLAEAIPIKKLLDRVQERSTEHDPLVGWEDW